MKNLLYLIPVVSAALMAPPTAAQEFRIETEVFVAGESIPSSKNLTLFSERLVFDFLIDPSASGDKEANDGDRTKEIVIYDSQQSRFHLLNVQTEQKLVVTQAELLRMLQMLRSNEDLKKKAPYLLDPAFAEQYDVATRWLELRSDNVTYRTRGIDPENEVALEQYHEFIDQFARLNATDPRRIPPFARLKLNQSIKKYRFIPQLVELSMVVGEGERQQEIKAKTKHYLSWELSDSDRKRIQQARSKLVRFEEVTMAEYRNLQLESVADAPDATESSDRK